MKKEVFNLTGLFILVLITACSQTISKSVCNKPYFEFRDGH